MIGLVAALALAASAGAQTPGSCGTTDVARAGQERNQAGERLGQAEKRTTELAPRLNALAQRIQTANYQKDLGARGTLEGAVRSIDEELGKVRSNGSAYADTFGEGPGGQANSRAHEALRAIGSANSAASRRSQQSLRAIAARLDALKPRAEDVRKLKDELKGLIKEAESIALASAGALAEAGSRHGHIGACEAGFEGADKRARRVEDKNARTTVYHPAKAKTAAQQAQEGSKYYVKDSQGRIVRDVNGKPMFSDRWNQPLCTAEGYMRGDCSAITVAMDPDMKLRKNTPVEFPGLTQAYREHCQSVGGANCEPVFAVNDTGGAMRGHGTSKIDIATESRHDQPGSLGSALNRHGTTAVFPDGTPQYCTFTRIVNGRKATYIDHDCSHASR